MTPPVPAPAGEAPQGPWSITDDHLGNQRYLVRAGKSQGVTRYSGPFTEAEAVVVRDALNRVASGAPGRDAPRFDNDAIRRLLEDARPNLKADARSIDLYRAALERELELAGASRGLPAPPTQDSIRPCDGPCEHAGCNAVKGGLPAAPPDVAAQSIVVSAKLDGLAVLMRNLQGHVERAALVHDDRFVAAIRETVQEIWRELEDMGAGRARTALGEGRPE